MIIITIVDFKEDTNLTTNISEESMTGNLYSNLLRDLWVEYTMSKVKIRLEALTEK